jgi:hypothetical protein
MNHKCGYHIPLGSGGSRSCESDAKLFYYDPDLRVSPDGWQSIQLQARCIKHAITSEHGVTHRVDQDVYEVALIMES